MKKLFLLSMLLILVAVCAQIGEHRNDLAIGVNGGYVLNTVEFSPTVSQDFHEGLTGGLSVRYVCEIYFSTICSVQSELNYSQLG
jgi:opacity protein-like surface antigen